MATRIDTALALGGRVLVGGCTTQLPSSRTEVVWDWRSYDDAVKSLARISPYTSTPQGAHGQGLDPSSNPTITVLHFALPSDSPILVSRLCAISDRHHERGCILFTLSCLQVPEYRLRPLLSKQNVPEVISK